MYLKGKCFVSFLLGCIFCLTLAVAPVAAERLLTLEECVKEVMLKNPDLMSAKESLRQSKARYQSSFTNFLPKLSANASYSRSGTDSSSAAESYSTGLSGQQSLFAGLRHKAIVKQRKAEHESAEANLQAVKAQVSFDLKRAFGRLLFAQVQLVLTRTIALRRQENVGLVGLRYEVGREHKGSYLRSQATNHQATFEQAQAKRALRVTQRELAKVLGKSQFDILIATGSLTTVPPGEIPDWHTLVLKVPDYVQAVAQARSGKASVSIAKSQFYPDVVATGSLSRFGNDYPPDNDQWSTGISISYPFFPGGRNYFDVKVAKAQERSAHANIKSVYDRVALRLEDTFAAYQNATEQHNVRQKFLEAALVRAEIARSQYTSGLLSFEDWDLIESDLINSQKAVLASDRDVFIAEANWELVRGKGILP